MKKGYSKIIIIVILIIIAFIAYWGLLDAEVIRNYKIKRLDIDSTITKNGDMIVKENALYRFNGKYNGIFITIPSSMSKEYYESITKDSINDSGELPDWLYNSSGIKDVKVYIEENGKKRMFKKVGTANNGDMGVYTVSEENGNVTYKIYEPSKNENKNFVIEYTLKDLAVKHDDVGEIYYSFIGGGTECEISKLNINMNILNDSFIKWYTHGNSTGKIEALDSGTVNVSYNHVNAGQYVSARVLFGKNAISDSTKLNRFKALDLVMKQERSYLNKSSIRIFLNVFSIIAIVGIFVYWIYLLIKYEKDKFIPMANVDDLEMLNKYNPMILACIAQNRDMHPRDIIAVLIDLVNIGALKMDFSNNIDNSKLAGTYILSKKEDFFSNTDKLAKLDEIQKQILGIFFDEKDEVELLTKLKLVSKSNTAVSKLKELDRTVTDKLEEIGANFKRIPNVTLVINNIIFIFTVLYILIVISYNVALNISTLSTSNSDVINYGMKFGASIIVILLIVAPLILNIIILILKVINSIKRAISKLSFKLTSKKLTRTIINILIVSLLLIISELVILNQSYIVICTILFCETLMLILTDNLMSSHENKVKKDYFRLKMIQDRIENESLLDEKKIEHNTLWEKYLSFAIALGVGNVSSYVSLIPEYNDLTEALRNIDKYTEGYYSIYNGERDMIYDQKIQKYTKVVSKFQRIYEESSYGGGSSFGGGSSSGGSSSFGGGGFSGGGGRRRRKRSLLSS